MGWATSRRGIGMVIAIIAILVLQSTIVPGAALGRNQVIAERDLAMAVDDEKPPTGGAGSAPPNLAPDAVELLELRSLDSRTFQNPDGTLTTEQHGAAIYYEEAGELKPIDTEPIASAADGVAFETKAAATRTSLGESSSAGTLLTVSNADYRVSFRPAAPALLADIGAAADRRPEVEDDRVYYRDVYPDVDLRYALFPHGVKEDIILKAPSAPTTFAYVLDAPGLKPLLLKDGSIELRDGDKRVFQIPAPFMVDSAVEDDGDGVRSTDVIYELLTVGAVTVLVISADKEWLADPKRVYPVYVDPTINDFTTQADTFISSAYPTTSFNAQWNPGEGGYYELWNGKWDATSGVNYAFIKTGIPSNATVLDADFHVYVQHAASGGTATQLNIAMLTSAFSTSQTWNQTHPTFSHLTHVNVGDNAWANYDVDATVQSWVSGTATNHGFRISPGSSTLQSNWKRLRASENYPTNDPYLTVNWTRPGVTPTSPVSSAWGKGTFAWAYAANSGPAQSRIQLQVSTSATTWSGTTLKVSTGDIAHTASSYTAATSGLASGTTYYWRVSVGNGTSWSGWSPAQTWKYDGTAPAYAAASFSVGGAVSSAGDNYYHLGNGTFTVRLGATDAQSGVKRTVLQLSNVSDPLEAYHDWGTTNCVVSNASTLVNVTACAESTSGSARQVTFTVVGLNQSTSFDIKHAFTDVVGHRQPGTSYTDTLKNLVFDAVTPTGAISSPTAGASLSGTATISGTASDANFTQYELHYGAGSAPTSWTAIGTNPRTTAVTDGTLGSWDTSAVADGSYTIRLRVYDKARVSSGFTEVTRSVTVNNGAPTAVISDPSGDRLVDGIVEISGTASASANFADYTLHYGVGCAPTTWIDIGTNPRTVPIADGLLGVWDTAVLTGDHAIRLVVRRSDGPTSTDTVCVNLGSSLGLQPQHTTETWDLGGGDELAVNVATGNAVVSHPLVTLPYRGGSLPITLTYNSLSAENVGLGIGWQLNLQRRLVLNPNGTVTFVDGDGARHLFTNPQPSGTLTTYTRPMSLYATLSRDDALPVEYTLTYRDGSVDRFDIAGSVGRLERSMDRHGNAIVVTYGTANEIAQVTDPAGRTVDFAWDGSGRLTSIADWAYINPSGEVQASATGSRRAYRFFHATGGQLAGWSEPLNTTGSCPTTQPDPYLTCLTYTDGLVDGITKTQTVTTLTSGALGTQARLITTELTSADGRVATVTDAEQTAQATPARTTFTWDDADSVTVARPTTTTAYEMVAADDPYARVRSVLRYLDPLTPIERRTLWDVDFLIEPASVTDNYGAALGTPARTVSHLYQAGSLGLVSRSVEPLTATTNRWTEYTYNVNNDVTQSIVSQDGSSTARTITRYCYSSDCATTSAGPTLLAQIDNYVEGGTANNDTNVRTDYVYDSYGQGIRVTRHNRDTSGAVLDDRRDEFTYDPNGNLTAEIVNHANGTVTGGDDVVPNATTQARTDLTTVHAYDTAGNRISTADPRRAILAVTGSPGADDYVTRWTHDALNRTLSERTPTTPGVAVAQETSTTAFDELGLAPSASDLGGLVSASEFDRAGRALRTFEDPAGTPVAAITAISTYDADGKLLHAKDRRQAADATLGSTTRGYDGIGRQTASTEADGTPAEALTTTGYDALDRRTTYVVGGQDTDYSYDLGGRVTATNDGFTCTTATFDYRDLTATTTHGKDGNGCAGTGQYTVTHAHDGLGRLIRDERGDGTRTLDDVLDAFGNRRSSSPVTITSGGALVTTTTTFDVNRLDQTVLEARADGWTAKLTYDPASNTADRCIWNAGTPVGDCLPVGASGTNPPDSSTTSTSDALDQRISLTDGATNLTTTYDPEHNYAVAATYLPTSAGYEHHTLYEYDERHRLQLMFTRFCVVVPGTHTCEDFGSVLGSAEYTYDANDSITRVTESRDGLALSDTYYCYDVRNQLVYRNTGAACSLTAKDESYTYDDAGNRLTATVGGATTSFGYTADGQYTGAVHDDAGRIVEWDSKRVMGFDAEGRITETCDSVCSSGSTRFYFTYDADGRRTRIAQAGGGTSTTTDVRYTADGRISSELVDGVLTREYVTDESGAILKLIVPTGQPGDGTYVVTWNGRGDALNLSYIDKSGRPIVANSYSYSTWGVPTTHVHEGFTNLGFRFLYVGQKGVQWDADLGLHLMGARHFSPSLARFMQPDPAALEENLYSYTSNSPVTYIDPSGLRRASLRACMCGPGSVGGARAGGGGGAHRASRPANGNRNTNSWYTPGRSVSQVINASWRPLFRGRGTAIIGRGTGKVLDVARQLARQYGGKRGDWAKMTSPTKWLPNGRPMHVHWYQNVKTGLRVRPKIVID